MGKDTNLWSCLATVCQHTATTDQIDLKSILVSFFFNSVRLDGSRNTTYKYISVIYHCRILARTLSFMLEPRFDLAWKEDLSDDSRALMARRFMEVTETLGVLMMAGQPDWRHTDVGVVVVVTPNICKYLLSTILSLDLPPAPCLFSSPV